jgi:hypothetical protein
MGTSLPRIFLTRTQPQVIKPKAVEFRQQDSEPHLFAFTEICDISAACEVPTAFNNLRTLPVRYNKQVAGQASFLTD